MTCTSCAASPSTCAASGTGWAISTTRDGSEACRSDRARDRAAAQRIEAEQRPPAGTDDGGPAAHARLEQGGAAVAARQAAEARHMDEAGRRRLQAGAERQRARRPAVGERGSLAA